MENFKNISPVRVEKTTIINLEKGKLPPQVLELEEAVLGAMMIDKKGVDEVIDILQPDAFYKEAHRHIFEAIVQLFTDTQPIDLLTVSAQLRRNAKLDLAGGDFYLIQLTQKISSSAHIEFHSRIILQKFIQRSLIKISSEIIEESYDETTDVFDLDDLHLDTRTQRVAINSKEIELTLREYALLEYFLRNKDTVLTRGDLLEHVWDINYDSMSNVVDVHLKNLRKKLPKTYAKRIKTIWGKGYKLV